MKSLFNLNKMTAIVTGASKGIGYSIALSLAKSGCNIIALSRSLKNLSLIKKEIENIGRSCLIYSVDISMIEEIKSFYNSLEKKKIIPNILINNAGVEEISKSLNVDEILWDKILNTNLKGAFFNCQYFAQPLIKQNLPGSIINICSLTSSVGVPAAIPYTSSKSGLLGMTKGLSSEWAENNIRVNAIGPGYFRTELTEKFYKNKQWQKEMLKKIPMNRFGSMEDLAGISIFLSSDASLYITGQIFYVDGGFLASI